MKDCSPLFFIFPVVFHLVQVDYTFPSTVVVIREASFHLPIRQRVMSRAKTEVTYFMRTHTHFMPSSAKHFCLFQHSQMPPSPRPTSPPPPPPCSPSTPPVKPLFCTPAFTFTPHLPLGNRIVLESDSSVDSVSLPSPQLLLPYPPKGIIEYGRKGAEGGKKMPSSTHL